MCELQPRVKPHKSKRACELQPHLYPQQPLVYPHGVKQCGEEWEWEYRHGVKECGEECEWEWEWHRLAALPYLNGYPKQVAQRHRFNLGLNHSIWRSEWLAHGIRVLEGQPECE